MRLPLPGLPGESLAKGIDKFSQSMINANKLPLELLKLKMQQENYISGAAREALSLDRLKNMLPGGEKNPVYQQAKQAYDLDQKRIQENIQSSEFYRTNPWRLYDPLTKSIHAQSMASQGKFPEGSQAYQTPEQKQEAVNTYEKERYIKTTPSYLQQQYEASSQIDEILKQINPEKAFAYSGAAGQVELWKDRYEAQRTGKPSQKLKDYEDMETYLHALREKIRNYWGSSITAGMTKDLDYLVNPSNWINHPEIAKRKYNAVVKDFENEKKVTERAVKHGNPSAPKPMFGATEPVKKFQEESQKLGLNPSSTQATQAVSKENILKTAREKEWSQEKTMQALRQFGHG